MCLLLQNPFSSIWLILSIRMRRPRPSDRNMFPVIHELIQGASLDNVILMRVLTATRFSEICRYYHHYCLIAGKLYHSNMYDLMRRGVDYDFLFRFKITKCVVLGIKTHENMTKHFKSSCPKLRCSKQLSSFWVSRSDRSMKLNLSKGN